MRRISVLALVALCLSLGGCAHREQSLSVIPIPQHVELQRGAFVPNSSTQLWVEAPDGDRQLLLGILCASPMPLVVADVKPETNVVVLRVVDSLTDVDSAEGYVLTVDKNGVLIEALSPVGLFYGVQTLVQMYADNKVPKGRIVDAPRCLLYTSPSPRDRSVSRMPSSA